MASCIIPGTDSSCSELVSILPWQFQMKQEGQDVFRLLYTSEEGTQQRNLRLKITLDVDSYSSSETTTEEFSQILKNADPDTGLSYGWDLVITRERNLYRLHADCTLAEQHFKTITRTLERIVDLANDPAGNNTPLSFSCRCGSGCNLHEF